MSAIAGIIQFDGRPVDRATLERMQTLLAPYGKDTQHHVHQGSAAFLRTLLRTTPEDSFDRQPLVHGESGTTLLFDGRIDNREELASALGLKPAETALMADSDLVLRACLRWDTGAVERLLGDFALACWRARERRLWLARDALGYRPLFWHRQEGFLVFATMPKGLFAVPGVPRKLREEGVHDYLCLLPMDKQDTLFQDVNRVEPGQVMVAEGGTIRTEYHHRFDSARRVRLGSAEDYIEALREHVDRAVQCRLRAVGPVASELSSGMDSSTVTAVAARLLGPSNQRLLALTGVPREGFDGPVRSGTHGDEGPGARALVARFENIDHVLVRAHEQPPWHGLPASIETLDRPPLNICNGVWVRTMHQMAAERGARVLLNGWFGNITLSYDGRSYLPWLLSRGRVLRWWREVRAMRNRFRSPGLRWYLEHSVAPFVPARIWAAYEARRKRGWKLTEYSAVNPALSQRLDTAGRARRAGVDLLYRDDWNGARARIRSLFLVDFGEYAAAQNVAGLEARSPLGDLRLAEFCLAIPECFFLREGEPQWILRRMVKDLLPVEILACKTRGLQGADWFESSSGALAELDEQLKAMTDHATAHRYLDLDAMRMAVEEWPAEGWGKTSVERRFRLKLLRGLSVGSFIRYAEDDNR